MNVTGRTIIFRRDFEDGGKGYSRPISSKEYKNGQKTDNWLRAYERVQFPQGTDIANKTWVDILNAFETVYRTQSGDVERKLVVMEWDYADDKPIPQEKPKESGGTQWEDVSDEDIPF